MPMMYDGYAGSWASVLFIVLSMLFWASVLGLLVWAIIRWMSTSSRARGTPGEPTPREILTRRYARGEIDTATYEDMLAHLRDREPEPSTP